MFGLSRKAACTVVSIRIVVALFSLIIIVLAVPSLPVGLGTVQTISKVKDVFEVGCVSAGVLLKELVLQTHHG